MYILFIFRLCLHGWRLGASDFSQVAFFYYLSLWKCNLSDDHDFPNWRLMKRKLVPFLIISDNFLYLFQLLLLLSESSTLIFFSVLNSLKTAMLLVTALASLDLSGKVCYLFWLNNVCPWWAVYQSWALILSSPAAEGIMAFVVRTPSEKDPWSLGWKSQSEATRLLKFGDFFPPEFWQISQSKVMQEPVHLTVCGLLNRGYSDRIELSLFSWLW